jgi:hypothetical protein
VRAAEGLVVCACANAGLRHGARLCRDGAPHHRQDAAPSPPSDKFTAELGVGSDLGIYFRELEQNGPWLVSSNGPARNLEAGRNIEGGVHRETVQ